MDDQATDPNMIWLIAALAIGLQFWMVRPALDSRRWGVASDLSLESLLSAALGVGVMIFLFGFHLAPIIVVAVVAHEYGHVLAYRLAGHPAPKFRLVPFGGVAMSDRGPSSQAESAYVALMGPGFSLILLVVSLFSAEYFRGDATWNEIAAALAGAAPPPAAARDFEGAVYAYQAAILVAALNAFNLLPFYPLDGGRALRAAAMTAGPRAAYAATVGGAALFTVLAFFAKLYILMFFAIIGLFAALRVAPHEISAPAMPFGQVLLALAAYGAVLATYLMVLWPALAEIFHRLG